MFSVILFCLLSLALRFAAAIPKGGDVDNILFHTVNHLAQAVDVDAAVGNGAVGKKRIYWAKVGMVP